MGLNGVAKTGGLETGFLAGGVGVLGLSHTLPATGGGGGGGGTENGECEGTARGGGGGGGGFGMVIALCCAGMLILTGDSAL